MSEQPSPNTKTTTVSIGGNVGGNVVSGDHNTLTEETTSSPPWWMTLLNYVFGWLKRK